MTSAQRKESDALKKARIAWLGARQKYEEQVGLYTNPGINIENKPFILSVEEHAKLIADIQRGHDAYDQALRDEGRPVPNRKS